MVNIKEVYFETTSNEASHYVLGKGVYKIALQGKTLVPCRNTIYYKGSSTFTTLLLLTKYFWCI